MPGFATAEYITEFNKLMHVLVDTDPGVSADEVIDSLPSVEEMQTFHIGLCRTASAQSMGFLGNGPPLMCALVCEKFGRHADALPWAKLASSDDCSNLGSNDPFVHVEGHRAQNRNY